MKKNILTAAVIAIGIIFATIPVQAADPTITADVPQTITMTGEGFNKSGTAGATWTVTSNNGFDISFSGTSQDDTGSALPYPQFSKQDVNATGTAVASSYDHLTTTCGVVITDYTSVEGVDTWNGGTAPISTSSPQDLVKALDADGSPDAAIGRIVPKDDGNGNIIAKVHLYVKGESYQENQSGNYTMTVTCTATANPVPP